MVGRWLVVRACVERSGWLFLVFPLLSFPLPLRYTNNKRGRALFVGEGKAEEDQEIERYRKTNRNNPNINP